jgi:HEAT repeat protein
MKKLLAGLLTVGVLTIGSAPAAEVADFIKKLTDKDTSIRRAAAKGLAENGPEAKAAIPALILRLGKDKDRYVRRYAAEALGAIPADTKPAIAALRNALNDEKQVAEAAVVSLGKIGEKGVPALCAAVKDTTLDPSSRKKAAEALGAMGAAAESAVPALTSVLKSAAKGKGKKKGKTADDDDVRVEAATALGNLATPEDKEAVAALESLLGKGQRNRSLRQAASMALRKIKGRKKF